MARAARPIRLSSCARHDYHAVDGKLGKIKRGSETVQWWQPFQELEGVGTWSWRGAPKSVAASLRDMADDKDGDSFALRRTIQGWLRQSTSAIPPEANNTLHPAFTARGLRSLQRSQPPIPVQAMTNRR